MAAGLFILLNGEESLQNAIEYGFYSFFMPPVYEEMPNTRSKHYAVLADYACCEEGTEIFFFNNRTVTYGGTIDESNNNDPIFYLNGDTSPLGRKAHSKKYIDVSELYESTENDGVYNLGKNQRGEDLERALPFVIEFDNKKDLTGKQISSDDLYFELGDYNFPFPSNTIQGRGLCTLTPKETQILLDLMENSDKKIELQINKKTKKDSENKTIFSKSLIENEKHTNESHLEFLILADNEKLEKILNGTISDYFEGPVIKCRQVPLCPFRPIQFDLADICLYDEYNPVKENSLPNVIIELKKDKIDYHAYDQVTKYLKWVEKVSSEDFDKVKAILVAPQINKSLTKKQLISKGVSLEYVDKIYLYSLDEELRIYL